MGQVNHPINDPYQNCESGQCSHDLARAITIDDLLNTDGPYPPSHLIVNLAAPRPSLFDDMEEPVEPAELRRAG